MEVVIDAGHGGADSGAIGNGIVEKDYALKISNYQYDRFKKLGIPVARTRVTDETISPDERINRVLGAFGNKSSVIVLANHLNSGGGDGAEIIYALRNDDTLPRIMAEEFAKAGQNVRKWYQRRLPFDPSKDYYFIIRDSEVTHALLVLYAFVDSTGDDVDLIKNHWQDLAEAVVRAVAIYSNVPYDLPLPQSTYTVKSGDSLWSIAKKLNTTVTNLKQLNNLTTNSLKIGQVLKIPGAAPVTPPETEYINYVVKSGDSLSTIAGKFNSTADEIKKLNKLTTNTLKIGQVLKIPSVQIIVEPEPTEPPFVPPPTGNTYTVASGDSLYSIARKFDITVRELKNLNNLTSDILNVGQVLLIPVTGPVAPKVQPPTTTYTVKKGDSLYSIANKFGTDVNTIKQLNNLTSNLLNVGQELLIPVAEGGAAPPIMAYTVKSGDSLYSIANKFGTDVNTLRRLNNLSSDILSIGQRLVVPV